MVEGFFIKISNVAQLCSVHMIQLFTDNWGSYIA